VIVAVYAWATDYATARNLADQVRDALDAYTSNGATDIQVASVSDGADDWIDDLGAFGCGLDVTLKFLEV
jgi:glycogen debranching enzyme